MSWEQTPRFVEGMDGAVAVATSGTGGRVLQLVDLHGDVTGTLPIGDGDTVASWSGLQFTSFDEFGVPEPLTSAATGNAPPRYGWLGAAQRSADTPTGTVLMGVRLYSPVVGRFLQVDPVPGGSASAYDYCNADPVNCTDLGGTFSWKGLAKVVAVVAETASMFVPGPVGAAVGALAAGAYLAAGDKDAAKMAAIGAAATLVGAGLAVAAVKAARVVKTAQTLGRLAARAAPKVERATAAVMDATSGARRLATRGRETVQAAIGRATQHNRLFGQNSVLFGSGRGKNRLGVLNRWTALHIGWGRAEGPVFRISSKLIPIGRSSRGGYSRGHLIIGRGKD